jgi:hypothetical protein
LHSKWSASLCRTGDCDDDIKQAIAKKLIALAKGGERNPDILCEEVVKDIRQPQQWAASEVARSSVQPLTLPDTLDPLVVDYPTRLAQELGDLAIAVAAVLPGKLDNVGGETLLVVTTARDLALRRAMLPERRTGATLGDMQLRSDLLNAGTATRGA